LKTNPFRPPVRGAANIDPKTKMERR
jgi:hypothetical protein